MSPLSRLSSLPTTLVLTAVLAAPALAAAPSAQNRDLVLTDWGKNTVAVCPGMTLQNGVGKGPSGETLSRVTLTGAEDGQDLLTRVNLPPTAEDVSIYMRTEGVSPGRHEALFSDSHGWTGTGNTAWSFRDSTTYTTSAAKHGWSWRVGFFNSKPLGPFSFRGMRLQGRDPKDTHGSPVTLEMGPAHVSYTPDDARWLYTDTQPKLISARDGVLPPLVLRVANLGTQPRTFSLSARLLDRNLKRVTGAPVPLGTMTLPSGQLKVIPIRLPLNLLGRYTLEYQALAMGNPTANQQNQDIVSVVNARDLADGFRHFAALRRWFSVEKRRPLTFKDAKSGKDTPQISVAAATNGLSPVPIFPVQPRIPRRITMWSAAMSEKPQSPDDLTVLSTQLSPAWLIRSQDSALTLFGDTRRNGLGGPSHIAFATPTGTRVLAVGASLDAAALRQMSQPWLLAWWQGSSGWTEWDAPYLVVLERRPTSLSLTTDGVSVCFAGPAGSFATMPLYGYAKLPQRAALAAHPEVFSAAAGWPADQLHPWSWNSGLPPAVAARCSWWSRALQKIPYNVHETYRINHRSGAVDVHDVFDYIDIHNDWKTPAITLAPLSPSLALAKRGGYPMTVRGKLTDCQYPTLLGPYAAAEGAPSLDYSLNVGPYWMQTADPNVTAPLAADTAARQAQESLLSAAARSTGDDEAQAWDYKDENFVWGMQASDMRQPAYQTAYTTGSGRQDRKGWLQARALYTLLDSPRYNREERSKSMTRRYIDGPGIGDFGAGDYGDAGKLGTDMIFDAYVYAYNTGDYQTIADYWDVITSLNATPLSMSWATQGRSAIAEVGDEAPPMLALARLAYAVGDRETYGAAVYWFARELVHNVIKDGAYVSWREQFKPWHPGRDISTETATNLWGTNASWQGGGFRSVEKGENQWTNFYVRLDDEDTLRFNRKYASLLPRRVVALATTAEEKNSYNIYFGRVVLLGDDPARARADYLQGGDKSPDTYATLRAIAEREFPPRLETLIPTTADSTPATEWGEEQEGGNDFGLVSESQMLKAQWPTPKWFWWNSPIAVPGVEWGEKWTFGSFAAAGPAGDGVPGLITENEINPTATLYRFAVRQER